MISLPRPNRVQPGPKQRIDGDNKRIDFVEQSKDFLVEREIFGPAPRHQEVLQVAQELGKASDAWGLDCLVHVEALRLHDFAIGGACEGVECDGLDGGILLRGEFVDRGDVAFEFGERGEVHFDVRVVNEQGVACGEQDVSVAVLAIGEEKSGIISPWPL